MTPGDLRSLFIAHGIEVGRASRGDDGSAVVVLAGSFTFAHMRPIMDALCLDDFDVAVTHSAHATFISLAGVELEDEQAADGMPRTAR